MSKSTVYRLWTNIDKYQFLICDDPMPKFDGSPCRDSWRSIDVYSLYPLKPRPDIWGYFHDSGSFAVSSRVAEELGGFFDESCELLPINFKGEKLFLVNVIEVPDCLDIEKSVYPPDLDHMIEKYAFHPNRLMRSLFKIPQTRTGEILCVERPGDPEFKGLVETLKLVGLRFVELWATE